MHIIINVPTAKEPPILKSSKSTFIAFGLSLLFGSARLMMTISATKITKTQPMRSRNGISGVRNLKAVESGMVSKAATRAAVELVRFQKKPRMKMATTPGEMKPVYSWMYWKAWSRFRNAGATKRAMTIATTMTMRPMPTSCFSEAFLPKNFL